MRFPQRFEGEFENGNDNYDARFFTAQPGLVERPDKGRSDLRHVWRGLDV
jgi:hypothetical protein